MSLKIYGHVVSQPTRAVIWACQLKGLPYELVEVDFLGGTQTPTRLRVRVVVRQHLWLAFDNPVGAGGTQTPEFKALNPCM